MTYTELCSKFNISMPDYAKFYFDDFIKEYDRKKPLLSEEDAAMVCDATGVPEEAKKALIKCAKTVNESDDAHLCGSFIAELTVYKRQPWVNYIYQPDLFTVEGLYPEQVGWVLVAVMLANTLNNKKPPEDLNAENLGAFKMALDFYKDYYPDHKTKAFACYSWILSAQLNKVLPENSNILKVNSRLHLIPMIGSFDEDIMFIRKGSSLQQKIADERAKGTEFHFGIMYSPLDELEELDA